MKDEKTKVGRPAFDEEMKLKAFNLPIELIQKIQKRADLDQKAGKGKGNTSLWARSLFERELKRKSKGSKKR